MPPGLGPEKTVTLVITDIQGSTSLWDAYPEEVSCPCVATLSATHLFDVRLVGVTQCALGLWLDGAQMAKAVALHHRCLRAALNECNGYEVATEGDSFKCAFHTPGASRPQPRKTPLQRLKTGLFPCCGARVVWIRLTASG